MARALIYLVNMYCNFHFDDNEFNKYYNMVFLNINTKAIYFMVEDSTKIAEKHVFIIIRSPFKQNESLLKNITIIFNFIRFFQWFGKTIQ